MSDQTISRQRLWQIKRIDMGLCPLCSKPRTQDSIFCPTHLKAHRDYNRERYHKMKASGTCPQCGKAKAKGGYRCAKCAKYMKDRLKRVIAVGLCVKCGQPRKDSGSKYHCPKCLGYHRAYQMERRNAMNKAGLCYRCGKPNDTGLSMCRKCLDKLGESVRKLKGHKKWKPGSRGPVPQWYKAQQEGATAAQKGPTKGPEGVGRMFMGPGKGEGL